MGWSKYYQDNMEIAEERLRDAEPQRPARTEKGAVEKVEEIFLPLLSDAVRENAQRNRTPRPDKRRDVDQVVKGFRALFPGKSIRVRECPVTCACAVSVQTEEIALWGGELIILQWILQKCNTASADPLTNGMIEFAVTIGQYFKQGY